MGDHEGGGGGGVFNWALNPTTEWDEMPGDMIQST